MKSESCFDVALNTGSLWKMPVADSNQKSTDDTAIYIYNVAASERQ